VRDLTIDNKGTTDLPLTNSRQIARVSNGSWLFVTDQSQRVTDKTAVTVRCSESPTPIEDSDFGDPIELAGNLTGGLLGSPVGPADQGSIVIDYKDVLHAVWRRPARDGSDEVWYAHCSLEGDSLQAQLESTENWKGLAGVSAVPVRVDEPGKGTASLGDIAVAPDGEIFVAYSQGWPGERRVILAKSSGKGWERSIMSDRWDFGDPVIDIDETGVIHLAYGPDAADSGTFCTDDFGEFHPRFNYDPRGMAERYGIYHTQSRDGRSWTTADGCTPGAELVAFSADHPVMVASRRTILIGYMARGNWPGMVDRVFYSSYREKGADSGYWKMHININRDLSEEVAAPTAFVDRYGQSRLAWVNCDRHHAYMSRWIGQGLSKPQELRWALQMAPVFSPEKRMPADAEHFGLLYLNAEGEIRFGQVEVPSIDPRSGGNVLFLDLWEMGDREGVEVMVNTATKDPRNPVFQGGSDAWDAQAICYGTVLYDEGKFKMWYTARSPDSDGSFCCYAVSDDGVNWERPDLGIVEYRGSKKNNICVAGNDPPIEVPIRGGRPTPNPSVYKDEDEPDPAKRYKMMLNSQYVNDVCIFCLMMVSPEGIHWTFFDPERETTGPTAFMQTEPGVIELMESNTLFLDRRDPDPKRKWKIYGQMAGRTGPGGEVRLGAVAHSPDGIEWTVEWDKPVLDPRGGLYEGEHLMTVWPYREYYLGVPDVWPKSRSCDDELTVSRDGYHFVRVANGQKVIGRGELGEWDAQFVSNANTLVIANGQILIYYAGTRQANLLGHPSSQYNIENATYGQTGLARVPVDCFTYLRVCQERSEGLVSTHPIAVADLAGLDLIVKADQLAPGYHYIVAELVEEADGSTLPGFTVSDCVQVDRDGDPAIVRWGDKRIGDAHGIEAVRIRFHLVGPGTRFYCFGFQPA
jgi:hypothetical protein